MPWYVNSLLAEVATKDAPSSLIYIKFLVAIGTLAVSFFLGSYLGKKLRMPDHGWKIGLCFFSLLASLVILAPWGPALKLGVDLNGGAILVYEVDQSKRKSTDQPVDMDKLLGAIKRRVNPGGQKEVVIRPYGVEQIEIIIPEKDEAQITRIERIISTAGNLQFRILANTRNNKDLIERALAEPSKTKLLDAAGKLEAWWVPVRPEEVASIARLPGIAVRERKGKDKVIEVLLLPDDYNVTGEFLSSASTGTDRKGQPCVNFHFNNAGGQLFGQLTGSHLPDEVTEGKFTYQLGIVLDDELYSAPAIQSTIFDSGEITGTFTQEQVEELVKVLNAGGLPTALNKEPISKLYSGALLGQDTIEKSTRAMIIASILIPLFMLWYYRFSGFVADIALVLNMLILFALMLAFKAAFTLTGFAGLALTVGMAVDNNVLVYERLREELERGATLRMAIRNAFQRASATIIDANLTTLIAAIVMYVIGTDQIKGFAVPLGLGVAISMFTSVFVARVIFDIAEKRQWITKVTMLRVIGHTNIDFMRLFPYTLTVSILITIMAIVVSIHRGQGLFDIDFTGGVSVQVVFKEPQKTDEVRKLLETRPETERLADLAITDVRLSGQQEGIQFVINTSDKMPKVKNELTKVFGDKLKYNTLEFAPPEVIPSMPVKVDTEKKSAEPSKKEQSRRDLPSRSILASAGDDALMLALADDVAKPADDKTAKPVDEKAAKPAEAKSEEKAASPALPIDLPNPATQRKPLASEAAASETSADKPAEPRVDPFAGGTRVQLTFREPLNHEAVVQLLTSNMDKLEADLSKKTSFDLSNDDYVEGSRIAHKTWTLKIMLPPDRTKALVASIQKEVAECPIFPASSSIGSTVAGKTKQLAVYSLVASWLCMIIYLWIRFQGVAFGVAAVVALIHDVFVMLGAIAISVYVAPYLGFLGIEPFKVNLTIVAAFLTIIGYSVNDTIIVFDRIREIRGKDPNVTRTMVNDSVNQTLSRTLITSFTVFLVVVILYMFGGEAVHGFAFVLMIGVATGTYSSIYIAAPILLWLVGKRHTVSALIER